MAEKPIYLICTHFFPTPTSWRGAFCYDFAMAVMRSGKYDVRVFVPGEGPDYEYHGIKVCRFRTYSLPLGFAPFLFARFNRRRFMHKARAVGVDWNRVEVFHAHDLYSADLIRQAKRENPCIKVLLHNHSGTMFHLQTFRLGVVPIHADLLYLYCRRILESLDALVCVSERQKRYMGKWYADGYLREPVDVRKGLVFGRFLREWRIKRTLVLYNGIDKSVFNQDGRIAHVGPLHIGCVANVCPEKDQLTLLRAAKILMDQGAPVRVTIVGSGSSLVDCKKYVSDNDLSGIVAFIREVDHLQLPELYRSFDLFVIPSILEGFCCSYMEAWGCGTPFMGCRGVSVEEALPMSEWDKWLFPPYDSMRLAELIEQYCRERYPQRLSRNFDIDVLVGEFVELVSQLKA